MNEVMSLPSGYFCSSLAKRFVRYYSRVWLSDGLYVVSRRIVTKHFSSRKMPEEEKQKNERRTDRFIILTIVGVLRRQHMIHSLVSRNFVALMGPHDEGRGCIGACFWEKSAAEDTNRAQRRRHQCPCGAFAERAN